MTGPEQKPSAEPTWKRDLKVSEECFIVNAEDIDLLELLLQDSECKQRIRVKLQPFDLNEYYS